MKNIEYYNRMAKELYDRAYSDGYEDGMRNGKKNMVNTQKGQRTAREPQENR